MTFQFHKFVTLYLEVLTATEVYKFSEVSNKWNITYSINIKLYLVPSFRLRD